MVGSLLFAGAIEVDLEENVLANSSGFSLEEVINKPSIAMNGRKKLSLKLLSTYLASIRNALLPLGHIMNLSHTSLLTSLWFH